MSNRGGGRGRGDLPIRESRGRGDNRGGGRGDSFRGRGGPGGDRGDRGGGRGRGRGDSRGDFRGRGRGGRGGGPPREQGPRIFANPSGQNTPSSSVTKTEDAVVKALAVKRQKMPGEPRYPERPGFGTQGQPVQLFANYFELKSVGKELFRYNVDIGADANGRQPSGRKARQVVRLLLDEHFLQYQNSITTDYRSTLVSNVELPVQGELDVRYRDENEDEYPENPKVYRVKVQSTGKLNPSDLLDYLTSANASAMFESKAEVVQAMNIVLGHQPKTSQSIASVGANRHYALSPGLSEKYNLGAGLEVLRGFFISARAATARLLVNVQVKYAACYQEGPLSAVIAEYKQGGSQNVYRLDSFLKKLRVRVTHITKKNKKGETIPRFKTIAGLATRGDGTSSSEPPKVSAHGAGPRDVQFFLAQPGQQPSQASQSSSGKKGKGKKPAKAGPAQAGRYVTVADFFREAYNIEVNPEMPVVNVGNRQNPSYLPVDVCIVEPGQPAGSKLTPNQTRNMLNFAVRAPALNAQSIVRQGSQVLGLTGNPTLTSFNIQPNLDLVTVPGRVLPPPRICYKDNRMKGTEITPQSGGWNMKEIRFSQVTQLPSWTWIYIDAPRSRPHFRTPDELNDCLHRFTNSLKGIGVAAQPPRGGTKFTLSGQDMGGQIEGEISQLIARTQPTLILCILQANSSEVYNCVKQTCDVRLGVRNICVVADKLRGANDQYFANVGLKFNLKLGGANQSLRPTDLGIISEGKTMVVGVDVTHPSPGSSSNAPSVAGMVGSIDSTLGQWPAELKVQTSRQENVSELDNMLKTCLQRWVSKKPYPENIIVYRDGVSEGQYDTVLDQELPLLRKACAETYPANMTKASLPRISIVVVGKRHHTRFYPAQEAHADRGANTPNGTVVDRGVTEARNWDFYLQAHTAIKGTARPAHYFTVWDEIFQRRKPAPGSSFHNAADMLEDLTHRMCYLFGRATKAVSICPPAYYADLVCERARCYLSSVFDPTEVTPEGSVTSAGGGGGGGGKQVSSGVFIHPNVRNTMFYI